MSLVEVHNEWDPLEEIIVGTAIGARVPRADIGFFAIGWSDYGSPSNIPSGPYCKKVIEETESELVDLGSRSAYRHHSKYASLSRCS